MDYQLVEVGELPAGLYFVQLVSAGRASGMAKFVKE